MSETVNYASTPVATAAILTTGSTSYTVPGAAAKLIFDPGANGGQCHRINVAPLATTTQTALRIAKYDGATYHLLFEKQIGPLTVSGQVANPGASYQAVSDPGLFPIQLPPGWTLYAWVNDNQTGVKVQGEGGGY